MQNVDNKEGEAENPGENTGEFHEGQFTQEVYKDFAGGGEYEDLVEELIAGIPEEARTNDGVTYEVKGFEDTEDRMVIAKVSNNSEEEELAENLLQIYVAMEQFKYELDPEEAETYEGEILEPFRQSIAGEYARNA